MMQTIRLGPAGSPAGSTLKGVAAIRELGLHAMEVGFVRGVKMSVQLAKEVGAARGGVALSVHAPYYINFASSDEKKRENSRKYLIDSCERAHHMGASPVVFHPGYYLPDREQTRELVYEGTAAVLDVVEKNGWHVEIAPEVMGRMSQFGDLGEILAMCNELKCPPCIDVCHIYARNVGAIDFEELFSRLQFRKCHFHFSGVKYGLRGEIAHEPLGGNPPFEQFAVRLLKSGMDATVICESPRTWKDSLKMKAALETLGYKFS